MRKVFSLLLAYFIVSSVTFAAAEISKKPFTFDDAMKFKRCRYQSISDNGNWVAYTTIPDRGDATAYVISTGDSAITYEVPSGQRIKIASNEAWAATLVSPKEIDKENDVKDKLKRGLALVNLQTGAKTEYKDIRSFEFSNDGNWLAFWHNTDKDQYKAKNLKQKPQGAEFALKHLASGTDIRIDYVNEFVLDSTSLYCFYSVSTPDGEKDGLYFRDLSKMFAPEELIAKGDTSVFGNLSWNHKSRVLAYTESRLMKNGRPDSTEFSVWLMGNKQVVPIITNAQVPKGYYIPYTNQFKWTLDAKRLFFGFKPLTEKDTTISEKPEDKYTDSNFFDLTKIGEKADVRVWHWDDDRISTEQIKWWAANKDRVFYAVYHLETNKWVQLADTAMPNVSFTENPQYALISDDAPYQKETTWAGWFWDVYTINLKTGAKQLIVKKVVENAQISPLGKFVAYFKSKNWWVYNNETSNRINLTGNMKPDFSNNKSEVPAEPGSYGFVGWHENDWYFYVYDEYDLWRFNTADDGFVNMFAADGRQLNREFRIRDFKKNRQYFSEKDTLLVEAYYNDRRHTNIGFMTLDVCGAEMFYYDSCHTNRYLDKAENVARYLFSRESYETYPDLWTGSFGLENKKQLTDIYPEIKEFKWGTTEPCSYTNSAGDVIDGYLVKPEGFNPAKKYPLLVYIYEKFSKETYRFYEPRVNHRPAYQIYNSDGYVVFVPDIKYGVGNPGKDALDCVSRAVDMVIAKGYIDTNRICLQGHSWGAYQAAYIATQPNKFAAICAGAPVGNMTSAYSGIRLESGMARQFQYEEYQSRIGGSLFGSFDEYVANSPVFETPTATVPLLILHGDIDGAVPWEQSIEIYLAYRRLGKNCIFLQYQNEPHWPGRYANKIDWAFKTKAFFDTYCLEKEAPKWMKQGEPYYNKW